MKEEKDFRKIVEGICDKEARFKPDAYEFIMQALGFAQKQAKKTGHLTGQEVALGVRDLAIQQYGPMAKTVLNHWGIRATADIGALVFIMIEHKLLSRQETDSIDDFNNVYDLDAAFANVLRDSVIKNINNA
jgi:uncharacterized repeat protein (TIGR04138 family)